MDVTSYNMPGLTLLGFYAINIPGQTLKNGYMKKISVTCSNNATLMCAYLTKTNIATGTITEFWRTYFVNNGEWDLNDAKILNTEYYSIVFLNYNAGIVHFTANISYIEV